jgi:endonuclease/exonuclease/phosphatase family metal-dependent hydrolase
MIIGYFNTPDKKNQQRHIILSTKWTLTDICRVFHPTATQYIFFSSAHGTFSKIDHILGHKASLRKYKLKELPIPSDHNGIKLELNNERNYRKY